MKLWMLVVLTVIAITLLWAFEAIRQRTYTGSEVQFTVGTGSIALMNNNAPIRAILTSHQPFTILGAGFRASSTLTSAGARENYVYRFAGAIPPRSTQLRIVHGANVTFHLRADDTIQVTVTPLGAEDTRDILLLSGSIVLGSLIFLGHVRRKQAARQQGRYMLLKQPGKARLR